MRAAGGYLHILHAIHFAIDTRLLICTHKARTNDRPNTALRDGRPVENNIATINREGTCDGTEQCGLTRSVGTDETGYTTLANLKRYVVICDHATKMFRNIFDFEKMGHDAASSRTA